MRSTRTRLFRAAVLPLLYLVPALVHPSRAAASEEVVAPQPPAPSTLQERDRHVAKVGADRWHKAGYRGKGVKVAILDTGFRGWRDHLGKALPVRVIARSFRADGNLEHRESQHGILCGEVVHTLAPDAELLFANWEAGHEEQFLAAVRWAKEQGAKVVSVSVIMPSWSDGEGGGTVHRDLASLLGPGSQPGDLLCFASAGNTTDRHWAGPFADDGHGWHAWQHGAIDNELRPWGKDEVAVELYGKPGPAYELCVFDSATDKEVGAAQSRADLSDRLSAAVRFEPAAGHSYRVRVRHVGGPAGAFHVTTTFGSLQLTTAGANVCFPSDGDEVVALGAVDETDHRHLYSARGTNLVHTKPDLVATVPFPSSWRPRPFGGTSAAAPQAAALAALCWSRHPDWNAARIREVLRSSAIDLDRPGPDCDTGFGRICLPVD